MLTQDLREIPPHVAAVLADAIEVTLPTPDDFLKVKETLTRIGVASRKDKTLYQSCHILHKKHHYFIVHFKELFLLDGKASQTRFESQDRDRRNSIANMLAEWGLVTLVAPLKSANTSCGNPALDGVRRSEITVLPFREKAEWTLVAKYEIGRARGGSNDGKTADRPEWTNVRQVGGNPKV